MYNRYGEMADKSTAVKRTERLGPSQGRKQMQYNLPAHAVAVGLILLERKGA